MPYDSESHGTFTQYFANYALEALPEYALIADDTLVNGVGTEKGIKHFVVELFNPENNHAYLRPKENTDRYYLKCYFLPWKRGETTSCFLDDNTDACLFFTSQMTGCRLSICYDAADKKRVTVLHIAAGVTAVGTKSKWAKASDPPPILSEQHARQAHEDEKFDELTGTTKEQRKTLTRRFSVTKDSDYRYGRSAFVIGIRTEKGEWLFFSQVAEGSVLKANLEDNKDVKIIKPHKQILKL